jgi:hypothetical protein
MAGIDDAHWRWQGATLPDPNPTPLDRPSRRGGAGGSTGDLHYLGSPSARVAFGFAKGAQRGTIDHQLPSRMETMPALKTSSQDHAFGPRPRRPHLVKRSQYPRNVSNGMRTPTRINHKPPIAIAARAVGGFASMRSPTGHDPMDVAFELGLYTFGDLMPEAQAGNTVGA